MTTYVARLVLVEVLDDGAGEDVLTDITVYDSDPRALGRRLGDVLSETIAKNPQRFVFDIPKVGDEVRITLGGRPDIDTLKTGDSK